MAYRHSSSSGYRRSTTSRVTLGGSRYRKTPPRFASPLRKFVLYALVGVVGFGLIKVMLPVANVLFGFQLPRLGPSRADKLPPLSPESGSVFINTKYQSVDDMVASLPNGVDTTVERLADSIARLPGLSETEKVRASFVWIARNIAYDLNRMHETTSSAVLDSRRAVCAGFATLMEDVCKAMGIECPTVRGIASPEMMSEPPESEARHAWNAVKIDNRWWLLDVTWAAQGQDAIDDIFFMVEPEEFIFTHFPDAEDWQFLKHGQPWSRAKFDSLPFISHEFFRLGLSLDSHFTREIRGSKVELLFGIDPSRSKMSLLPSIKDSSGEKLSEAVQRSLITSNGSIPDQKLWKICLNFDELPEGADDRFKVVIYGDESPLNSGSMMPALISYEIIR